MKKSTRKLIQKIIDEKYQTDSEFIINEIAPEVEQEEFDIIEICNMIEAETIKRNFA